MATKIESKGTASKLGRRGTSGGRLMANRELMGGAIVVALALAFVATVAAGRVFSDGGAGSLVGWDGVALSQSREVHSSAEAPGLRGAPVAVPVQAREVHEGYEASWLRGAPSLADIEYREVHTNAEAPALRGAPDAPAFTGPMREVHGNDEASGMRGAPSGR